MKDDYTLQPGPHYVNAKYALELAYFDVDNTLVPNESSALPSERFIKAAQSAKGHIKLAIASARPLAKVSHIIEAIGAEGLCVLSNGAQIYDALEGAMVEEWTISPDNCLAIVEHLIEKEVECWINDDGVDYFPRENGNEYVRQKDVWTRAGEMILVEKYRPNKPFVVVAHGIAEDELEDLQTFIDTLQQSDVVMTLGHELEMKDGTRQFAAMITYKNANKKYAIHRALELQDVDPKSVMAVGDGYNDIVLMEAVGVGVAVANAAEETKQAATFIAPARSDDGAAVALEAFL